MSDDNDNDRTSPPRPELRLITESTPSAEKVRLRAYQLFLARGGRPGSPEDDWTRAEQELRSRPEQIH